MKHLPIALTVIILLVATMLAQGPPAPYSVNLTWTLSSSPASTIAGYNVYRATYTTSCGAFSKITSTPLGNTVTAFNDPSVQAGSAYCYAETALGTDGAESGFGNVVQDVQIPPAPPTNGTAQVT